MSEKSSSAPSIASRPGLKWRHLIQILLVHALAITWMYNGYTLVFDEGNYILCSKSNSVYTVDELKSQVACIWVKDSNIFDTGSLGEIKARNSVIYQYSPLLSNFLLQWPRKRNVNANYSIVPGLADAHAHILEYGFMTQLPLFGTKGLPEILNRVKAYVHSHPDIENDKTKWIEGMGWDQTKWPTAQFPTAADLESDLVLRGRPISLTRVDGHAKWVSQHVLELMGDLPDNVDGGFIVRDADGRPTGVFVDNAMALIPTPEWTEERTNQFFQTTMKDALAHGLTSIHDAMSSPEQIQFFKKKAEEGKLPNRLYLMGHVPSNEYWGSQIPQLINHGKQGRLTVKSVKLVADGALGSWGAALLQPYSDKPEESGLLLTPPKDLSALVHQFWKDGFQVNIHCIGDRANNIVLDIFEDILTKQGGNATEWRPRIEHAQIFTMDDIQRVGKLEEKLTRTQALKGMTLDAAYASFAEKDIGSLTPGKKADFVILSKNIMTVPVADILTTEVVATLIDGQVVYGESLDTLS
ncbi:hypothetical protein H0H87_008078 [Tephrocybe sp. NHM501043]|nr:hypothetical protein H0H87_008078 [Tephrocybe sp. NHM501043]